MIACEQTKIMKVWTCTNAIYCTLRAWKLHKMQNLYCTMDVCVWTLAFLKVSIRVYVLCMEHIACHLGTNTPLRDAIESICTYSNLYNFGLLWAKHIAIWDSGNSVTMSFRNLHVHHMDPYGSYKFAIYIAYRRSTDHILEVRGFLRILKKF